MFKPTVPNNKSQKTEFWPLRRLTLCWSNNTWSCKLGSELLLAPPYRISHFKNTLWIDIEVWSHLHPSKVLNLSILVHEARCRHEKITTKIDNKNLNLFVLLCLFFHRFLSSSCILFALLPFRTFLLGNLDGLSPWSGSTGFTNKLGQLPGLVVDRVYSKVEFYWFLFSCLVGSS